MNRHENYKWKRSAMALRSLTEVLLRRSVTAVSRRRWERECYWVTVSVAEQTENSEVLIVRFFERDDGTSECEISILSPLQNHTHSSHHVFRN